MEKHNIVFFANISYPNGMAATHRIQHFITACERVNFNTNILIPFFYKSFQNPPKGTFGKTCFHTLVNRQSIKFFNILLLPLMLLRGVKYIKKLKNKGLNNVLYIYDGITLENIIIVLFAKLIHYKIFIDIVEDYSLHEEKISFSLDFKLKTISVLEKYTVSLLDGVIVISKYLEEKYKKLVGFKTKPTLIPVSASIPAKLQPKTRWHNSVRIVYSGSYGKKDGVNYLIEAFLLAQKEANINISLNLLGKGSNSENILKYKKNTSIIIHGYISDKKYYKYLNDADILCMTRIASKYANAGFPFKLGEYLATGNSVIASNVSDIKYYLEDKTDIILTVPESVESIKDAILYLVEDFSRARIIGVNGYNKALKYFNEKNNGEEFVKCLLK